MKKTYLVLFLLTLFVGTASVYGATIHVPTDHPTIQGAIDAADPGDEIIVGDGTYYETLTINKENITLRSENGPENCTINRTNPGNVIEVRSDGVIIEGFTIMYSGIRFYNYSVIEVNSDNNIIRNNDISGHSNGIYLRYSSNNNITNNTFDSRESIYLNYSNNNSIIGNNILSSFCGIHLFGSSNNIIIDNNVSDNWDGIVLGYSNNNSIINNNISDNLDGIVLRYSNNNSIIDNIISNNSEGIYLRRSSNNSIIDNIISNNSEGIYLRRSSNNSIIDNIISNNSEGIVAISNNTIIIANNITSNNGKGIYIYGSNSNIINNTISDNGEEGIKLGGSNNNITNNNIILNNNYGIYLYISSNNSIIENNISLNNNSGIYLSGPGSTQVGGGPATTYFDGSNNNIIIDNNISDNRDAGIKLGGLNNSIIDNIISNNTRGIYLWDSSNAYFDGSSNNNITNNNISDNRDGGIELGGSNNSIIDNIISNNTRGIYLDGSSNNITSNNISNNKYGIYLYRSSNNTSIIDNNISDNRDAGIYLWASKNNDIIDNIISNNNYGIRLYSSSNNSIANNNISNNRYDGIYLVTSSNNNSITNNNMTSNGISIYLSRSRNNNIIDNIISNNFHGIQLHDSSNNNIIIDNIILNSNGNSIYLSSSDNNNIIDNNISNNSRGIYLLHSDNNNIIDNIIISNNYHGIDLEYSDNNIIIDNIILNNRYDIKLEYSGNISIKDNVFINNSISIQGRELRHWMHTMDNNTVNGKALYYFKNKVGGNVSENAGQVILVNCSNMIVENLRISNMDVGIIIAYSSNITVKNNNISNNDYGIKLEYSGDNIIYLNNFNNSYNYNIHNSINNTWNSPENMTYIYNNTQHTGCLGNYWSNYIRDDTDGDGIGDMPYYNIDQYPLIKAVEYYTILEELKPNLKIVGNITTNTPIYNNTQTEINLTIINDGNENINTTFPVEITITNASGIVVHNDTANVSGLNAGEIKNITFNWTPNNTGTYNITAFVDPENIITESDESDNRIVQNKVILENEIVGIIENIKISPEVEDLINITKLMIVGDINIIVLNIMNINDTLEIPILNKSMVINITNETIENMNKTCKAAEEIKNLEVKNVFDVNNMVGRIKNNINPISASNFNIKNITKGEPKEVNNKVISTISFRAENTSKKGFAIVRIPIGNMNVENITINNGTNIIILKENDISSKIGWYRMPTDGVLEITVIKDPEINVTLSAKLPEKPNLIIENIITNTPIYNGTLTEINLSIINNGNETINTTFPVEITIKNASGDVVYTNTANINGLNAGAMENIAFSWTPNNTGIHSITAFVDSNNIINESDENDNNFTLLNVEIYEFENEPPTLNNNSEIITLKKGWNVLSIPHRANISFSNPNAVESIITYYNNGWNYKSNLEPLYGYYIYCNNDTQMNVIYITIEPAAPPTRPVFKGWNLVGVNPGQYDIDGVILIDFVLPVEDSWVIILDLDGNLYTKNDDISSTLLHPYDVYWMYNKENDILAGRNLN